ncbi:MAG: VOC family protein [Roseobacter sp.]
MTAMLEHTNFTVSDVTKTTEWMTKVFDWQIRWQGPAIDGGHTVHIGTDTQYLALYQSAHAVKAKPNTHVTKGGMNHIAMVVENITDVEKRVKASGFAPHSHDDYEPGKRFYFRDHDEIEFEVVQYD